MPAIVNGIVFNDLNNDGQYTAGEPGIPNVYVVLYNQSTSSCIITQTNTNGIYSFVISTAGAYTIYETVSSPTTCPPNNVTQPSGFTSSNSPRKVSISVTTTQINANSTISNNNFAHTTNSNPVGCSTTFIQFRGTPTQWINVNLVTGNYVIQGYLSPQLYVNAIAINPLDNYIYGIDNNNRNLVRIDKNGTVMILYKYPSVLGTNLNAAAFSPDGFLYLYSGSTATPSSKFYTFDLRPTSVTYLSLVDPSNGYIEQPSNYGTTLSATLPQIIDWGYNKSNNLLYGVNFNGIVQSVNPLNGQVSNLTSSGIAPSSQGFGAVITDNNGVVYALSNQSGKIYRINILGNIAVGEYFTQSLSSNANDGAFCINASVQLDFGDAPDTSSSTGTNNYNTLLSNNGPRHLIVQDLCLGTTITAENDALQNATATGDDIAKGIYDDGVINPITIYKGFLNYALPVTVTNNRGSSANLYGWIDFNKDGVFQGSEAASSIIVASSSIPQIATLNFTVPSTITTGYTFARIRLTSETLTNTNTTLLQDTRSIGPAQDGEVEDYYVSISLASSDLSKSVKGNNKSQAIVSQTLQYIVTIPNTGALSATNVYVYDALVPGLQLIGTPTVTGATGGSGGSLTTLPGFNIGTIPSGNTASLSFDVLVVSVPNPSTYLNTATISYSDTIGNTTLSVAGPTGGTPILSRANLNSSTKGNNKSQAIVGQTIQYMVTIPNTGSIPATNVYVYDALTPGLQVNGTPTVTGATGGSGGSLTTLPGFNIGTISSGGTASLSFDVLVVSVPNPSTYLNIATISYSDTIGNTTLSVAGPTGGTPILSRANLNSSTKGNNKSQAIVGQTIQYMVTIPNTGSIPATNVYVYDALTPGLQVNGTPTVTGATGGSGGSLTTLPGFNIGTISSGGTASLSFDVLVVSVPNPSTYLNTATIYYTDAIGNSTLSVAGPTGGTPILSRSNLNSSTKGSIKTEATIGDIIPYVITIPNTGSIPATNIYVYDALVPGLQVSGTPTITGAIGSSGGSLTTLPGFNVGTISSGSTASLSFDVLVVSVPNPSTYLNTATISYFDTIGNNSVTVAGPTGGTQILNLADITSSLKGSNKSHAVVGEVIQYTITIPNTGFAPAKNVYIYDNLIYGLQVFGTPTISGATNSLGGNISILPGYNIGTISAGSTATFTFNVLVASLPNPSTFINSATIFYNDAKGLNTLLVSGPTGGTQISNPANLSSTTKGNNKVKAQIGEIVEYTITIPNTGSIPATDVYIYDKLIPGMYLIGTPTISGATDGTGGSLTTYPGYNIGTISAGNTAVINFNVVATAIPNPSTYLNTATIAYQGPLGSTIFSVTGPTGGTEIISSNCYYLVNRINNYIN